MDIIITAAASVCASEFLGYWIHTLLHSEKVKFLSGAHMHHHLHDYAPSKNQRSNPYKNSGLGRFTFLGLGVEWLVPLVPVTFLWATLLYLCGVSIWMNLLSVSVGLLWGYLMFGVVHENFHIENSWFLRNKILAQWFTKVRRLHDIHHHTLTDDGRLPYNMGICLFLFDRIFGTYRKTVGDFNTRGLTESKRLYGNFYE